MGQLINSRKQAARMTIDFLSMRSNARVWTVDCEPQAFDFGLWTLGFGRLSHRHRIIAATAPRMAASEAFEGQPGSGQRAMPGDGFQGIGRATGFKPALAQSAKEEDFGGRNRVAVKPHTGDENVLRWVQCTRLNKPAFFRVVKKSFSTSCCRLPTMEGRATSTRARGCTRSC